MSTASALALVLAAIVAVAALRILSAARRTRDAGPHAAARLLAMLAAAVLLYLFLLPPAGAPHPRALAVLTAGSTAADAVPAGDELVLALPEAPDLPGVTRVPDLGTALRRFPGATPLRVRGEGLAARDRDAAIGLALEFAPPPLPAGLVELAAPVQVGSGRQFAVAGRVEGLATGQVELLDPAGARVDGATLDEAGRFRLTAVAGPAGRVDYRLRTTTRDERMQEEIALPLDVQPGAPLRVWVLAGGPGPELKYLRRWALDAGLSLHTRIAVGGGVDLGDPPRAMTPAALREVDLVVIDDRAWRDLGEHGRSVLRDAVREGLGVLLRLTADPGASDRRLLQEWGFQVETAELARGLRLPGSEAADTTTGKPDAVDAEARANDTTPLLSRRPLRLRAADGVALQRAPDGEPFALWRAEGRGRIALWTLSDSFRLVLAGRRAAHGSLWAQTFATLARPAGLAAGAVPENARVGERAMLCAATAQTAVQAPNGTRVALAVDPASGARACAAYWPAQAGWHERIDGDVRSAFPVRAADSAPVLAAAERREATAALAGAAPASAAATVAPTPGPRWPWGLGWLLVSAALWWLERPRGSTARD